MCIIRIKRLFRMCCCFFNVCWYAVQLFTTYDTQKNTGFLNHGVFLCKTYKGEYAFLLLTTVSDVMRLGGRRKGRLKFVILFSTIKNRSGFKQNTRGWMNTGIFQVICAVELLNS